jgi:branched-chain amino acid transport system substrate-binding protein
LFLVSDWFPEINRPGSQEVNSRFREQFGTDMLGAANTAYASTWVVKEALEIAGAADRQKLFEVLRNLRLTGGRIGFMYDFVSFCDIGLNEGAQGVAAQVIDGRVLTVWPEEVRVAEPVWPVPHWDNR